MSKRQASGSLMHPKKRFCIRYANEAINSQESTVHQCPVCDQLFPSSTDLLKHFSLHDNDFQITHSQKQTPQQHHEQNQQCPVCDQLFPTSTDLQVHFNLHEHDFDDSDLSQVNIEGQTTICPVCELQFASYLLEAHLISDHQDFLDPASAVLPVDREIINVYRGSYCPSCSITFRDRDELQRHLHDVHPDFFTTNQTGTGILTPGGAPVLNPIPSQIQFDVVPVLTTLDVTTKYLADIRNFNCSGDNNENNLFAAVYKSSFKAIRKDLEKWKNLRVFFTIKCLFVKALADGMTDRKVGGFVPFIL